jgi:Tfp pilus assembly protein PilX
MFIFVYEKDNKTTEQGFVLVMTLLYLLVVTLLVSSAFASSLLQTKMDMNTHNTANALQNAETALTAGERAINIDELQGQGSVAAGASYIFSRVAHTECGLVFYQVNALGVYTRAKVNLRSLFAVPTGEQEACPDDILLRHRVYWMELN